MVGPGRSRVNLITWLAAHRPQQWTSLLLRIAAVTMTVIFFAPVQAAARQNVEKVWSNDPPLGGYQLGDFNGDGSTDLFRVVGTQWQYASAGIGAWQNLASDPTPQADLRFGDFNDDGRTDVFSVGPGGQWRYSDAGLSNWINLASDATPISDLRFGDFNGDGRTDVFSVAANGQWRYSAGGQSGWINLASDTVTVNQLRFGFFDANDAIDVFNRAPDGQWRYSSGGATNYIPLANDPAPISELALGDFNGDGISDVFNRTAGGQWRYSPSGTGAWINLASDPTPFSDLRFGDFNGDNITDVFSIGPGNVPRYSSGGTSSWIGLSPGGVTATPTATTTPTATPTPTTTTSPTAPPTTAIESLRFGDFNGDGCTDVFRSDGGQWQYSSAGVGPWQNLAFDPLPLSALRFGDFNGDGRTDVFSVAGDGTWRYSDAGLSNWITLRTDTLTVDQLRFGDFNGDGRTDVFSRAPDGRWRYSDAGQSAWIDLATDPLPLDALRFGDFNGDGRTDVFSVAGDGTWRYADAGQSNWIPLRTDTLTVDQLRFGDFNGDGYTDVFSRAPDGRWRYSDAGQSGWIELAADPLPLSDLRFGDFNCDGRTDVFSIGPDGRWRYSDAGQSNWILLGPPSAVTVTVTPGPVTPVPDECPNVLRNGDFEYNGDWIFGESPVPAKYTGAQHQSGIRSVRLGIPPDAGELHVASYSSIRQLVMVPPNATVVTLRWWRIAQSQEGGSPSSAPSPSFSPQSGQDRQEIIALAPNGDTIKILQRVLRNEGGGWRSEALDLTEFAGKSFYLYFNVYNDGFGGHTWMYLDNVSLNVCQGPMGPGYGMKGDWYGPPMGKPGKPGGWMPMTETPTPTPTFTPSMTPTPTATGTTTDTTPTPTVTPTNTPTETPTVNGDADITDTEALTVAIVPPVALLMPISTPIATPSDQGECVELVNNGNFEAGDTGWNILAGPAAPNYTTEITFNRSRQAMRLGLTEGDNRSSISAIDQIVGLPDSATSLVLSFRYYPLYEPPPGPGDLQYVDIYNATTGQFAGRALGVQADDRTWLTTDYDLTALAGQTVRLVLAVNNDGVDGRTAMYVDNVSIIACTFIDLVVPVPTGTPAVSTTDLEDADTAGSTQPGTAGSGAPQSQADLLAGRNNDPAFAPQALLTRLGAIGVMAGVLGAIGFAAFVIIGTLREPD